MSTQHRTTHSSMKETSGGSGCAVFLIVAGIGLAVLAIGFGIVVAFVTIEASETESGASEIVIEEESVVEQVPESIDSSSDSPPMTYQDRIADITDRVRQGSDDYTDLMARIGERDEEWEDELFAIFTVWRDADTEVGSIIPPPVHSASHELLTQAIGEYREAADIIGVKIIADEPDQFSEGTALIADGALTLHLAESMLADELN